MGQVPVPTPTRYFMKNTIKEFIKRTLGCNCPDEGFEQTAHVLFDGLKDKDDRVHLHIVEDVPWEKL